ncbi:response regulator [Flavobacterium soyangense]|uniref:Response regulator n=1 Tax=Flavobacterium soyangense TaxID=2023265 RepID=A0A930UFI6_9FLAO|nr:response regulator [Flavobacterium soyangense]MBF2709525.1 response regulator [Flavobacterium soyangense]
MKKNYTAFIVEDDKIASSIIKKVMKSNNSFSSCKFYLNGLIALDCLKALNSEDDILPSFILLDFIMPVMNGLEFLENIKYLEGINKIPIFMNSSSTELDEYQNFYNYENVKGSFSKPFMAQNLNAILEFIEGNRVE